MRGSLKVVAGFLILASGSLLLVPLPEAGVPLILLGLRLLGSRFEWARRANVRVDKFFHDVKARWKRLAWPMRFAITLAVLSLIGLLIWWWLG